MTHRRYQQIQGFRAEDITPDDLKTIAIILEKYGVDKARFGTGGRLAIAADQKVLQAVTSELQIFPRFETGNGITYIHFCPGHDQCKYGFSNGKKIADKIAKIVLPEPLKAKVKVGIAACRMCCTEPYIKDVGLVATAKGWTVLFGGNGGGRPRIADLIAEDLSDDQAVELVRRCLLYYQQNSTVKMRTARFMEKTGTRLFCQVVLSKHP
jgi:NAD(P)H-nitrite reductase large subunit